VHWKEMVAFQPQIPTWQRLQNQIIFESKEIDLELKFENFLMVSNDYDLTIEHLKLSAKRLYEQAAAQANSRPNDAKMININQLKDIIVPGEPEVHLHKTFNLGMVVPDGHLDQIDTLILDAKKELFGSLLQENEDIRKIEQELINADPSYAKNFTSNAINVFFTNSYFR
jgi:hypothetical protein